MLGYDYASAEGKKFAESVLKFMNKRLLEYQDETGSFYNLEATPAEGASYKLALTAKKTYPKIMTSGKDVPYFTNSTMLPVNFSTDVFKVLEHQDSIQSLYTGGTVLHTYLGQKINGEQAKLMVKTIISKYRIPYISITPTFSICPTHGYLDGEHPMCPKCTAEKAALEEKIKILKEELK
jgi:ribonucleoside-triphosphate reductase